MITVSVCLIIERQGYFMKTKHKHLTLENRVDIEIYLTKDYKLKTIAYLLRKDQSTISKKLN